MPSLHEPGGRLPQIPGTAPQLSHLPEGCPFRPRCAHATARCAAPPPPRVDAGDRMALCHHPLEQEAAA